MKPIDRADTMLLALGRRLRVAQWNRGKDGAVPPLLIFNGIGMNLELIDPLAAALAPRRVVSFDMPGVGRSPDPVVPYTPVTMAMTAGIVLDKLEIARVDVLGISWGGGIAQQFALQHRSRVERLVLAATSAGMVMAPGGLRALSRLVDSTGINAGKAFREALAMVTNGGGRGAPVSLNAATPPSPAGWWHQLAALASWTSVPLLPWLDIPTLIVAGEDDQIVPPLNARVLQALIPRSRLRLIPGAGHLCMLSHTDAFVAEIERFLDVETTVESV